MIYDPELTSNLPLTFVCSGMMMAHAVEALYAQDKNPIVSLMALEAITQLAQALPEIVQAPHKYAGNVTIRSYMVHGWLVCVWVRWGWQLLIKFAIA